MMGNCFALGNGWSNDRIATNLTLTPKKSVGLLSFSGLTTRLQGVRAFFSGALLQTHDSHLRLRIPLLLRSYSVRTCDRSASGWNAANRQEKLDARISELKSSDLRELLFFGGLCFCPGSPVDRLEINLVKLGLFFKVDEKPREIITV
jgi:hypothetical protein